MAYYINHHNSHCYHSGHSRSVLLLYKRKKAKKPKGRTRA
uniref:Uncharacterized protein n=1 Tax=Wuchereria bancrofti TaxID=6293 RepID=A0A1I8E8X1_WUCBA